MAQKEGLCTEAQLGQPIIDTAESTSIGWKPLDFTLEGTKGIQFYEYPVEKTGYYCVVAWTVNIKDQDSFFTGVVEFNNKYGTLAGSDFPKLPVSPALCIFDALSLHVRKEAHSYCLERMAPANLFRFLVEWP
jgi:hypothetical protein